MHICSYTPAVLVLFLLCLCVCVCGLTGLVECVEESEGLRRDGAWEHGVLQQRAAGEAPLHHPPHVSLLILLAPAQANTQITKDRHGVTTAEQVREMQAARASYDARLPNLVSVRMTEEDALPVYM
jgi:hypothetical protein